MKIIAMATPTALAITLATGISGVQAQSTPQQSSPAQLVDALHSAFGDHHVRAVHAKGVILQGSFTPDAHAAELTKAFHLQKESSEVTVRFSDFTGIPDIPDNAGPANPRGFAVKFTAKDGKTTDIIGHSFNGFPTATSDEFRVLLLAIGTAGTDAKPTDLDKFLDSHPIAKTFLSTQKTPASYATSAYFGVNAFKFTNKKGASHFIRYQFEPVDGEKYLGAAEVEKADKNYLVDEIKVRVTNHPIKFKMYAQIAEDRDKIEDPSIAWPATRKRVLLGVITINKIAPNTVAEDKALFFIPNNVPDGIATADPMLDFRSKAYPISVEHRQ